MQNFGFKPLSHDAIFITPEVCFWSHATEITVVDPPLVAATSQLVAPIVAIFRRNCTKIRKSYIAVCFGNWHSSLNTMFIGPLLSIKGGSSGLEQ